MSKQQGINAKKTEDFSEWYTQVIQKADLADYSKVSGCMVYKPKSYAIWEKIKQEVDKRFKKAGIQNAYFPLFIPESLLIKEQEHVKGFAPEVAWVTQAGDSKLNERLAIRPTSETIMYDSYAKWIRSYRDLPLRLNQWNNVVRWEFKHPVPFLRTREFLWNEGHTVFATQEEAKAEKDEIIGIYKEVCEKYLALPSLIGRKSEKEKFAGAEYTISMEFFMPHGKAIQGPDFHHDGQNFAKAFEIKFLDEKEKEQYVYQNTFAITTRMIGIVIAVHSDDNGLIVPPKLAENPVVIVPIFKQNTKDKIIKHAKELSKLLKKFNPLIDERDYVTPGFKFNDWELKGIPLRIEIGPKDIENRQVVLVRRDSGKKETILIKDIELKVEEILKDIQDSLFKKAKAMLDNAITKVKTMDELKAAIKNKKIALAPWCESEECEDWIKDKADGAKTLNMPLDQPKENAKCVNCEKPSKVWIYIGKSY